MHSSGSRSAISRARVSRGAWRRRHVSMCLRGFWRRPFPHPTLVGVGHPEHLGLPSRRLNVNGWEGSDDGAEAGLRASGWRARASGSVLVDGRLDVGRPRRRRSGQDDPTALDRGITLIDTAPLRTRRSEELSDRLSPSMGGGPERVLIANKAGLGWRAAPSTAMPLRNGSERRSRTRCVG